MAEIDTTAAMLGYSFTDGTGVAARNRSKGGAAYKPLIEIRCSSHMGVLLHVHLELDLDFGRTSGWNIQDGSTYKFNDTGGSNGYPRLLSVTEKAFLSAKFPNWNKSATWKDFNLVFNSLTGGKGQKQIYEEAQTRLAQERVERDALAAAQEIERATQRTLREAQRLEAHRLATTPETVTELIGKMSKKARDSRNQQTLDEWKALIGNLNEFQPSPASASDSSPDVTEYRFLLGQGAAAKYDASVRITYKNKATADRRKLADIQHFKNKLKDQSFTTL